MADPRGATDPTSAIDPTRVREQPSLTTSTGRSWLIVGGLFGAISVAVLLVLASLPAGGVAVGGAIIVVVLYAVMIVARFVFAAGRVRLWILAWSMIAMAVVSLGCVLIVTGAQRL